MFEKGFLQDVRHNLWEIAGMIFHTRSNIFSAYFPEQTAYQQQVNLQTYSDSDPNAPALWRSGNKYLSGLPDRTPVR